jgi:hypothetical protein
MGFLSLLAPADSNRLGPQIRRLRFLLQFRVAVDMGSAVGGFSLASPPQSPSGTLISPAGGPGGRGLNPLGWERAGIFLGLTARTANHSGHGQYGEDEEQNKLSHRGNLTRSMDRSPCA